jgi:hypothetical protein
MFERPDDRGRPVRAYRLGVLESMLPQLVPRRSRRAPAHVLWRAYFRVLNSSLLWAVGFGVVGVSITAAGAASVLLEYLGVPVAAAWSLLLYFVLLTVGTFVYARYVPLLVWARWRSTLLEHDCCPSCGYRVAELVAEGDGCVVCPECGSAWSADLPGHDGGLPLRKREDH